MWNVLPQAVTKWSELAFDDEYGELGLYGKFSSGALFKSIESPKTSSVETWWKSLNFDFFE